MFDLSFIPSYKCDLKCWFCMYDCSPDNKEKLDIDKARHFIVRLDLSKIHMFGFYGGEISINQRLYQKFINLTSSKIPRFTITNGSWSKDKIKTRQFLDFIFYNNLETKVSSTPEHIRNQNREVLEALDRNNSFNIKLKENDDTKAKLLPMGRLANKTFNCSLKCTKVPKDHPYRIALEPNGEVIFQNCDGVYPVVGTYENSLEEIKNNIHNIIMKKRKLKGG
jgi:hypothetical protein